MREPALDMAVCFLIGLIIKDYLEPLSHNVFFQGIASLSVINGMRAGGMENVT